jgi:hypothetical protein
MGSEHHERWIFAANGKIGAIIVELSAFDFPVAVSITIVFF